MQNITSFEDTDVSKTMHGFKVKKRDGRIEPLDLNKIHKVCFYACEGIEGVSVSELEMRIHPHLYDGISTDEINEQVINAAKDLIAAPTYNYDKVGGRMISYVVRKQAYGQYQPWHLKDIIKRNIEAGRYDPEIPSMYSDEEWDQINSMIDHRRDDDFRLAGAEQMRKKYLVKHRVTGQIFESFQIPYIMVAAILFRNYPKETRLTYVRKFYDLASRHYISLPTPIMAGLRTATKQFSSCVVIDSDDSLASIGATDEAAFRYVAVKAGLGINAGRNRGLGAPIRKGDAFHTGLIPFMKKWTATVKSCSQGGVRDGAVTMYFPMWHYEFPELVVLKDNALTEEKTNRSSDYCVQLNKYLLQRLIAGKNITLFSPYDAPGLYEAFYTNQAEFARLYEQYEADPTIRKRSFPAADLFNQLVIQRMNTGRIYVMFVDNANERSSFTVPIYMSNLCVAEDTLVLTDKGHVEIKDLVGKKVNVWNGEEWSEVEVVKTGENQELITVTLSDGSYLVCTPYHKFYIQDDYDAKPREVRAAELQEGDKLIKFKLPVLNHDGLPDFPYAYTHGFFCGDGTYEVGDKPRISLYGEKKLLVDFFDKRREVNPEDSHGRLNVKLPLDIAAKYTVPHGYSLSSKLRWLEGLFDADGTVSRNGENESLQLCSIRVDFLREVKLLLQTLGVNSKVTFNVDRKVALLPDGCGGYKEYVTQPSWRLLISSSALVNLIDLGFSPKRLKVTRRAPQRNAEQFVKVESVTPAGRGDTYCFNEPKRHMGVFNGILTGNCTEITLPTKPLGHIDDPNGEISLCTLAAVNWGKINSTDQFEEIADILVRALNEVLDYQDYPVKAAYNSTMARRPLGIGIIGLAHFLAKRGLGYNRIALGLVDEFAEAWSYYLIKASVELAKEKGPCPAWGETKYSRGWTPNLTRPKALDDILPHKERMNWDDLRTELKKYGIRNSTLMACMPSETSSQLSNETNGIEPPRSAVIVKASKDSAPPQVVPDVEELLPYYDWSWSQKTPDGYLEVTAVIQKYVDQAMSINTSYNPAHFPEERIGTKQLLKDLMRAYQLGHKTLYYCNTKKPGEEEILGTLVTTESDDGCDGGACKI